MESTPQVEEPRVLSKLDECEEELVDISELSVPGMDRPLRLRELVEEDLQGQEDVELCVIPDRGVARHDRFDAHGLRSSPAIAAFELKRAAFVFSSSA